MVGWGGLGASSALGFGDRRFYGGLGIGGFMVVDGGFDLVWVGGVVFRDAGWFDFDAGMGCAV